MTLQCRSGTLQCTSVDHQNLPFELYFFIQGVSSAQPSITRASLSNYICFFMESLVHVRRSLELRLRFIFLYSGTIQCTSVDHQNLPFELYFFFQGVSSAHPSIIRASPSNYICFFMESLVHIRQSLELPRRCIFFYSGSLQCTSVDLQNFPVELYLFFQGVSSAHPSNSRASLSNYIFLLRESLVHIRRYQSFPVELYFFFQGVSSAHPSIT